MTIMTMIRDRHIATWLLLLLLLLMAGVSDAWAEVVTTPTYYLNDDTGGSWVSAYTGRYTVSTASTGGDGNYTQVSPVGNGDNGTRVYTASTNGLVSAGVSFRLLFDIKIKGGSDQASWFQVNDYGNTPINFSKSSVASGYVSSSVLLLSQTAANGTTWSINGNAEQTVTLEQDKWYTFNLLCTSDKTFLKVTSQDGSSTVLAETEITTNSTKGGLGNMEFATKRYNSSLAIDNIKVLKWGWDVSSHSVSLTSADNDNKITSGMPVLYNPDGSAVTYSYEGTVLSTFDNTYPPRLKAAGSETVTASIGGKTAQYELTVTAPTGGGTYNAATSTYTFDKEGIVSNRSVDDVPFIGMSFRGGPTAVVVNRNGSTKLKVIDANGFSHPNLTGGNIPPENNWGGTFYRFTPSVGGTLTVTGTMDYAKLYESNGTVKEPSVTSGTEISVEGGKVYYLYNAGSGNGGSNVPLLHSFKFVPNASSLTFRNPRPVITVDVSEASYTNPAISAQGLPVTYSIMSGSDIAEVDGAGKVTFKGDYFLSPAPVVVKATAGTENITYTIDLVKRTWIFNDNSKWKTVASSLTSGGGWDTTAQNYATNGLNGSTFYRNTKAMNYDQLTTDGTTVMSETAGLLFNKEANNDRLYIAPKNLSPNFLAMRASSISIDDVLAGQTVTVNWTGGKSQATLDMSDAAGENVTASRGGTLQLTATQTGRVRIFTSAVTSYINSISVSTPTRAIGSLTYAKTVLSTGGGSQSRTGYTITTEDGTVNLKDAYSGPGNFKSSNTGVVTVDGSGNITPVSEGTAIITATATAKNSATHQATVTLVAAIEVVADAGTRIRTISISDLLYDRGASGVNASNGLNRRIPGFDLTFEGGDGAKVNDPSILILRNSGSSGKLTITPRLSGSETVTINQALVTVKSAIDTPSWSINGGDAMSVTAGGELLESLSGSSLSIEQVSGTMQITSIKIYYTCSDAAKADECLDETKVGPTIKYDDTHIMRIPNDGRAFSQTPTQVITDWFKSFLLSYTYASSAINTATINTDGTNGQLLKSGESTITATFHETKYFAGTTASYTIDNMLLPDESYADVSISDGQRIHIEASAYAANTPLTLTGTGATPNQSSISYGTTRSRNNTYATGSGTLELSNTTSTPLIIYSLHVVSPQLRSWLYYPGQEDNYLEQVLFTGFHSGAIAGFRVVDVGDPDNPIDLTDAYKLGSGAYTVGNSELLTSLNSSTGEVTAAATEGSSTIGHVVSKKAGMADGYDEDINISTTVQVLKFGENNPVVWNFESVENTDVLGRGWTNDDRGYQYGYFSEYTPILNAGNTAVYGDKHGILLKDEFRWYYTRGLRANLSQPRASFKFPVKAGMEIEIYAATSSADISNVITNVTDIYGNSTNVYYIEESGEDKPSRAYFLAKEDGMVEVQSTDKVGMYLHSIKLSVPKIHFTDDVVTVLPTGDSGTGKVTNATTNIPDASLGSLSYTITSETNFDGETLSSGALATIDNTAASPTKGQITLTNNTGEGWFEVTVTNNNASAEALEPRTGSYKVYVVDFKFNPAVATLNLDAHDGEDYYGGNDLSSNQYPVGKDKVVMPIDYTYEIADGNSARAMLRQITNTTPGQTTYQLTAYSPGVITLKATTGRITATCELTVEGNAFGYVAPVLSDNDITAASGVFENTLPSSFVSAGTNTVTLHRSGDITSLPTATINGSNVELSGLSSIGHGAIRCIVTNDNGTSEDNTDDVSAQFVLTIAYPASSKHKWNFYRMKNGTGGTNGLKAESNHDNKIGDYASTSVDNYTITGTNSWTTETSWTRDYRNKSNGGKEPRWVLNRAMRCDNAFVIEETAGLMIETPTQSFYVDNNSEAAYTHIGIHSRSTITIPKLKNGDFVSLNLSRVIPNNGAIIEAENVTDLAGRKVTSAFTITRSQTDYHENGVLAVDGDGKRIIPGYYTFIAHKDGAKETDEFDVSFTLADEGYLDVLSIEIYSPGTRNSGNGTDPENGYDYTMLPVKLDATGYPDAPATLLKEEGQQMVYDLTYCHPLWSTSVGPAEYELRDKSDNLNASLENVGWYSAGGAFYNSGRITVNEGYGKILVRMNNYTAEGRYLIGYTPTYSLTVGHPPHQDYPFTWNFENISGGAVFNRGNNAYNNISNDPYTWKGLGYDSYQLDTRTSGGSLYVPGATLVTEARDMGQKGEISYLNANNYGCDEFNGLGFTGQFTFRAALQGSAEPATPAALTINNSLLTYTMTTVNRSADADKPTDAVTKEYWTAGDGLVKFGNAGKRAESVITTSGGAHYLMDGGNTKYLLIKPERTLKEGDIITLKGYTPTNVNVSQSGFSFYAAQMDNANDALLTLNWETTDNTVEHTLTHTVKQGDGLAGRDSVYIFRADKKYSVYLTEISITPINEDTPTIPVRALTCNGDVTVTIPDLLEGHYVYIKSSATPKTIPSNLIAAVTADGLDAATGVYKYKVTANGNANVTFEDDTKIYRIGVTNIMKPMTRVGSGDAWGDAWATESRDHAIDYTQTGAFTVNDIKANTVTAKNYGLQKLTVQMNEKTDAMPANTGLILKLKLKYTTDDENSAGVKMTTEEASTATTNAVANLALAKSGNQVPLFYPPYSATILSSAVVGFGGTEGNLMKENVTAQTFTSEEEEVGSFKYTRFIFAQRYMQWKKENGELSDTPTSFTPSGVLPVFYRLHLYSDSEASALSPTSTTETLNTLGAYKAYMLIRSGNVPKALWDTSSSARAFIGIAGVSDMGEITGITEHSERPASAKSSAIYDLRGQCMGNDEKNLAPGIYIRNGKKFVIR